MRIDPTCSKSYDDRLIACTESYDNRPTTYSMITIKMSPNYVMPIIVMPIIFTNLCVVLSLWDPRCLEGHSTPNQSEFEMSRQNDIINDARRTIHLHVRKEEKEKTMGMLRYLES
ncbi:hypothetical protein CEXT_669791 [Caerostris extrusa]|uniref:Uncharacterized protein n=1 Tax=Caerostris extrusa TaxID=172846 RepID=A0AAV4PH86_CAEEX|nr:hypothetical protein CEXT_669791 [Caerostris extrusa]